MQFHVWKEPQIDLKITKMFQVLLFLTFLTQLFLEIGFLN